MSGTRRHDAPTEAASDPAGVPVGQPPPPASADSVAEPVARAEQDLARAVQAVRAARPAVETEAAAVFRAEA